MDSLFDHFYRAGGTLEADAPCYVEREADRILYHALNRGEFGYVLTSRQMGKSSLMNRTAARLRADGVAVAILDLTALGANQTAEQWYWGLLELIGDRLGMEAELDDYWEAHEALGPLRRWMAAIQEVVLPQVGVRRQASGVRKEEVPAAPRTDASRLTPDASRLVIFIDEIDCVRSLPFSTDEFFAAIRECYNRRSEDPEYNRLTFCLLGVATPSDLIRDVRMTPFNIGTRIDLTDFTEAEAAPLAMGLTGEKDSTPASLETQRAPRAQRKPDEKVEEQAQAQLHRVLYWTGGHPYLTQRLCHAIAEAHQTEGSPTSSNSSSAFSVPSVSLAGVPARFEGDGLPPSARGRVLNPSPSNLVDQMCHDLFLSARARERDDNLLFVRDQLLKAEVDLAGLLDLYGRVRAGKRVLPDDTNPLLDVLRLSGILRSAVGRNLLQWAVGSGSRSNRLPLRPMLPRLLAAGASRFGRLTQLPTANCLKVRNRIYERVFDRDWVRQHMPDAELRRQRAAYRRGLLRATALAAVIIAVMGVLTSTAVNQTRLAKLREVTSRRNLYVAQMGLVPQAWEAGNVRRALELLDAQKPGPGQEDLRGFEWRYFWRLCQGGNFLTIPIPRGGGPVAFSPDGGTARSSGLLALANEAEVEFWDVASHQKVATLPGHTGQINGMAFSPNGKTLATASEAGTVKLWDLASRRETFRFEWPADCVAFSPDGTRLTAGSGDGSAGLWDLATRRKVAALPAHGGTSVAISPDGRMLVTGSFPGRLRLWNIATHQEIADVSGEWGNVYCVAFSPDGKTVAAGSWDQTVRLWNVASGRVVAFRGHAARLRSLAFSPDGKRLATGSEDHTARLWDVATGKEVVTLRGHTGNVVSVAFSPDGRILATGGGGGDGTARLWNTSPQQDADVRESAGRCSRVTFSPDGRTMATGSSDGKLRLWDVASRRAVGTLQMSAGDAPSPAFSPDGTLLAAASKVVAQGKVFGGVVKLWDTRTRREVATLKGHRKGINAVEFSPDGRLLATGSIDAAAKLWDVATRREVDTLHGHEQLVWVAFSPDGRTLATASWDRRVKLWDVASRRAMVTFQAKSDIWCVRFSPDGQILAAGADDGTIHLWDVRTRRELPALLGHNAIVVSLAFSAPDGKTLASGSMDHTIKLWNLATRQEVTTLKGHTNAVYVAFSPDGKNLASCDWDGHVKLWRAATLAEATLPDDALPRQASH